MKKRILAGAIVAMAVLAIAGCGKKNEDAKSDAVNSVEKAEDITYDLLFNANKGSTLLEKYESVQYVLTSSAWDSPDGTKSETWSVWKEDENYVLTQNSSFGESMVYANGTCYYEDASVENNVLHSMGWFMDEDLYNTYVNSIVNEFLINEKSSEDFDSVEEQSDQYIILSAVGSSGNQSNYYRYTVDKDSLEIQKFEAVIKSTDAESGETTEQVMAEGNVTYNAECAMPEYVAQLESAEKTRTIKITIDPDTEAEKVDEFKLPANVTMIPALKDSYGLYENTDPNGNAEFDDTETPQNADGAYEDVEVFCINLEAAAAAE